MRRIICVLVSVILFVGILSSCSYFTDSKVDFIGGIYILKDSEVGPYVFFDTDVGKWRCGAGVAVSYSLGGRYEQNLYRITAYSGDSDDAVIEFQITGDNSIKAISVKGDFFPGESEWIKEESEYVLKTYGEAVDAYSLFRTVCDAETGFENAKKIDCVTFDNKGCVHGKDIWDKFFTTVSEGKPSSVVCAFYYQLNRESVSEELYNNEKNQYPKLFFYYLVFDGKDYTVEIRQSSEQESEQKETYKYLLHLTGKTPSTALYTDYDNYVLVDDASATWEGILSGIVSSQADAGYRHCVVYKDCIGWK